MLVLYCTLMYSDLMQIHGCLLFDTVVQNYAVFAWTYTLQDQATCVFHRLASVRLCIDATAVSCHAASYAANAVRGTCSSRLGSPERTYSRSLAPPVW